MNPAIKGLRCGGSGKQRYECGYRVVSTSEPLQKKIGIDHLPDEVILSILSRLYSPDVESTNQYLLKCTASSNGDIGIGKTLKTTKPENVSASANPPLLFESSGERVLGDIYKCLFLSKRISVLAAKLIYHTPKVTTIQSLIRFAVTYSESSSGIWICRTQSVIKHPDSLQGNSSCLSAPQVVVAGYHPTTYPYYTYTKCLRLHPSLGSRNRSKVLSSAFRIIAETPGQALETLSIDYCGGITSYVLQQHAKYFKNLTTLGLSGVSRNEVSIIKVISECPNLKKLCISGLSRLSNFALAEIGTRCKKLEIIDLSGCTSIRNEGLCSLVTGKSIFERLKRQHTNSTSSIHSSPPSPSGKNAQHHSSPNSNVSSPARVMFLCKSQLNLGPNAPGEQEKLPAQDNSTPEQQQCLYMPRGSCHCHRTPNYRTLYPTNTKLRYINISNCPSLTRSGIEILLNSCPNLSVLVMVGCSQTSLDCAKKWQSLVKSDRAPAMCHITARQQQQTPGECSLCLLDRTSRIASSCIKIIY